MRLPLCLAALLLGACASTPRPEGFAVLEVSGFG
jgi:hypothetical protein